MVIHLLLVASLQSSAHVFRLSHTSATHSQSQSIRIHEPCLNPHILNSQQFYMCTHVSITIFAMLHLTLVHLLPSLLGTQSTLPLRNIQQSAHTQVYLEASPPVGVWHTSPDTVERLDARPVTILPLHTSGVPKSGVGVLSFFILFPMTD